MQQNTTDIIRDATADIIRYRTRRLVLTVAFAAAGLALAYFGFITDDPSAVYRLFRQLGGSLLGLALANLVVSTIEIRDARRVIAEAEAGRFD